MIIHSTNIEQVTRIFMCLKMCFDLLVCMGITNSMSNTNSYILSEIK